VYAQPVTNRRKSIIPDDLRGKLPGLFEEFSSIRSIAPGFGISFAMLFFILSKFNNVWLYYVPTGSGPLVALAFLYVRPLNPYRSLFARIDRMVEPKRGDASPQARLVCILASRSAFGVSIAVAVGTSLALLGLAWLVSLSRRQPATSSLDVGAVLTFTAIFAIMSLGLQCHCLLRWTFRERRHTTRIV